MARSPEKLIEAERILEYRFNEKRYLKEALTHPSAKNRRNKADYERLEFLGDSILSMIVAAELFKRYPEASEGELTKMKIALVAGSTLSEIALDMGLLPCIYFGNSPSYEIKVAQKSALEDVFESLAAALFLDGGIEAARIFILCSLDSRFKTLREDVNNPKSELQEELQTMVHKDPVYKITKSSGPSHKPLFYAEVLLGKKVLGKGKGGSKKEAERCAARAALLDLRDGALHVS